MQFTTLFLIVYLVTTIAALVMTYIEQQRRGHITPVFTLIGYGLCLVWPLVAAVMMLAHRRLSRQSASISSAE
jgi:multisubunit Na+/H+ antiporter MnhE subunit